MVLLRLLADILLYLALGLLVYWWLADNMTALWIAIGFGIISAVLFMLTADVKRSRRQHNIDPVDILWDWWLITELIEIPFRLLGWILSRIWRIFD